VLICGIKASHDGAVALVENGRLLFSVELEKLDNGMRHAALGSLDRVGEVLRSEGVDPADVDQFVVDGWIGRYRSSRPDWSADSAVAC
jgi:carbamoyltransferase